MRGEEREWRRDADEKLEYLREVGLAISALR